MIGTVSRTAQVLREADQFLILTHRRPDGDTTGSAGALCQALRKLGKTAYLAKNEGVTRRYAALVEPYYAPENFQAQTIVAVDVAAQDMLPPEMEQYADCVDVVIDHHKFNPCFGKTDNLIGGEFGACAEIIWDLIVELGIALDESIARSLYIGTATDTGCFKFTNTTVHTHQVAIACLQAGVDCGDINTVLFDTKSRSRFDMEKILYDTMQFYHEGKIAAVLVRLEDRERTGADWDDLDSIAGLPRQIEGVEVGLTFSELENGSTKVSIRTTKEVDAAAICRAFGGGGHVRAAGATLPYPAQEAMQRVLEETEKVYCGKEA